MCFGLCACAVASHQVLVTQPPELLELLGHEELGTPHRATDLPQHCRGHITPEHRSHQSCIQMCPSNIFRNLDLEAYQNSENVAPL